MAMMKSAAGYLIIFFALASVVLSQEAGKETIPKPDYSKEGYVIEQYRTSVTFENDGTSTRSNQSRVRVQSDAGVQKFGLLTFVYQNSTESFAIDYLRVLKADGSVVVTPPENVQDMPSDITRNAPLYSDIRQKHVAVKGLSSGDVLEYQCQWKTTSPLAPGQFWFDYDFDRNLIVLDEQLEIRVPRKRQIKLKSAEVAPKISETDNYRVYVWKTTNLTSKTDNDAVGNRDEKIWRLARGHFPQPAVRMSSFESWEEVGRWYSNLQKERIKPTPEIQAKAAELTKDAADDMVKLHAIYRYVSTQFRYIAIDFGIGRYQPHKADEVLQNQYGDCKDKHTLLAALLGTVGIKVYPALIGSSREVDEDVPSPSQFDHVISVVPQGHDFLWLDTTPEVAPFAHLMTSLRDKNALVIPDDKPSTLVVTPVNPPFKESFAYKADGKLGDDGVLDAKIERTIRGDIEILLRGAFRRLPESQWKDLAQAISYSTGFSGTVSDVIATRPENTEEPFHIVYSYNRKDYSDWSDKQITPPLPSFSLTAPVDDDKKPSVPFWLGAPGEILLQSRIEFPKGYKVEVPSPVNLDREFAEYHSKYELKDGAFAAERHFVIKRREVLPSQAEEYKSFLKAIRDDENRYTTFSAEVHPSENAPPKKEASVTTSFRDEFWKLPNSANPEAERQEEEARMAWNRGDMNSALGLFEQAVTLDEQFARAWVSAGDLYLWNKRQDAGLHAYRMAVRAAPAQIYPSKALGFALMQLHKYDEAIQVWQSFIKNFPEDKDGQDNLGLALFQLKRYSEAVSAFELSVKLSPDRAFLERQLGYAYLKTNQSDKAIDMFQKALKQDAKPTTLNSIAYTLAEASEKLPQALEYAERAVHEEEEASQKVNLASLKDEDLGHTQNLAAYWDTLGWVNFRMKNFVSAEKYLNAAWSLSQYPVIADHLGQVYEQQHKTQAAIHIDRLALAAAGSLPDSGIEVDAIIQRLKRLGAQPARKSLGGYPGGGELSTMRATKMPRLVQNVATAEFFLLFSPDSKVKDVKFVSGSEKLKFAAKTLAVAKFDVPFPDNSAAQLVRRGVLGCYPTTGCSFVLLTIDQVKSVH